MFSYLEILPYDFSNYRLKNEIFLKRKEIQQIELKKKLTKKINLVDKIGRRKPMFDSISEMWIAYFDPVCVKIEIKNIYIPINNLMENLNNDDIFKINFKNSIINYDSIEYKELENNFISWWFHIYDQFYYE